MKTNSILSTPLYKYVILPVIYMPHETREATKSPEVAEVLAGVGALIVTPDGYFLTVEEAHTNRRTGKTKGMRSIPMESLDPGETDEDALFRALGDEEVKSEVFEKLKEQKPEIELCLVQLTPGVWLHTYLIIIPSTFPVIPGNGSDVTNPGWNHINEVLESTPGSGEFRPGNREVIKSYLEFRKNSNRQPGLYFQCVDEIPQEVFDKLEKTTSQD